MRESSSGWMKRRMSLRRSFGCGMSVRLVRPSRMARTIHSQSLWPPPNEAFPIGP